MANEFIPPLPPDVAPAGPTPVPLAPLSASNPLPNGAGRFLRESEDRVRENPYPVLLGALLVGIAIGAAVAHRERRAAEPAATLRTWVEGATAGLAGKVPDIRKQIRHVGKNGNHFAEQARELIGRRFNLW